MEYQEYLKKILNKDDIAKLNECYKSDSVNGLRVNLLKTNKEKVKTILDLKEEHSYVKEAFVFNRSDLKLGKDPLHYAGAYYLQEPSAMMVVNLLGINKGDKVLDLCAAPGGKSTQVLSYLKESGMLVSNDISYKRAQVLSENIERMGASNAYVLNQDIKTIESRFEGYFDKVILDAPCSGQGMFRKNEEVYNDWTYNKTLMLKETNKELIMSAYKCLKKDGILVYSTCTFTKEENEEVIEYLLNNTNASVIKIKKEETFSEGFIEGTIRLYPFSFKGEGHFICLIKCNDEHRCRVETYNKEAIRKEIEIYKDFEKKYLNIELKGKFIKMGDELHLISPECFSLNKLKLLRNGLHLGTIKNNRFEPNHSLALYLKKEDVKYSINYDHLDQNVINYLKGMTMNSINIKGYVLICVNDISLGWGKDDTRMIKNLYPKGLRIM